MALSRVAEDGDGLAPAGFGVVTTRSVVEGALGRDGSVSRGGGSARNRRWLHARICAASLVLSDLLAFVPALLLGRLMAANRLALGDAGLLASLSGNWHYWGSALLLASTLLLLATQGHYTQRAGVSVESWRVVRTLGLAVAFAAFTKISLDGVGLPGWLLVAWVAYVPLLIGIRQLAKRALAAAGVWTLRTLVIADPGAVEPLTAALHSERSLGYQVVGDIPTTALWAVRTPAKGRQLLRRFAADFIVLATGGEDPAAERSVLAALARGRIPFAVAPRFDGLPLADVQAENFFSHDVVLLRSRNNLASPVSRALKYAFDCVLAGCLLLFMLPLFGVLALLIRADGGPVLFRHTRIGARGKRFQCLKFRTMVTNSAEVLSEILRDPAAAAEWRETQKLRDDPRITKIGRLLRKTSLDELPQLMNVLRGDMSLVGPRPIVADEVPRYGEDIVYYYETRPGVTGLWQVSGRSNTSYEHRVHLDTWYVRNWSLWCDMTIMLKTIPAVLLKRGAV
jgi:undecaprenyl-phosphate galactose phosphotransferase